MTIGQYGTSITLLVLAFQASKVQRKYCSYRAHISQRRQGTHLRDILPPVRLLQRVTDKFHILHPHFQHSKSIWPLHEIVLSGLGGALWEPSWALLTLVVGEQRLYRFVVFENTPYYCTNIALMVATMCKIKEVVVVVVVVFVMSLTLWIDWGASWI